MKRLRTLSIKSPNMLDERLRVSTWGYAYWKQRYQRRQREAEVRRMRQFVVVPLIPVQVMPNGDALPGEQLPEQQPTKH